MAHHFNYALLDPFSGSATTGIAANLLGRSYVGIELEEDFLALSRARRTELDDEALRTGYLERLRKSGAIER